MRILGIELGKNNGEVSVPTRKLENGQLVEIPGQRRIIGRTSNKHHLVQIQEASTLVNKGTASDINEGKRPDYSHLISEL